MKTEKEETIVLGAGPAGISSAFELSMAGRNVSLIEKEKEVGGLAKTVSYGDFRADIGPHRFFSRRKHLYELIEKLLHERWIKVDRFTRFYIDGNFFHYPVEIKDALPKLGPSKLLRLLSDYLLERLKVALLSRDINSFEDHAVSNFGRSLAELNMLNYTEKVWGLSPSEISSDWAKQRIKGLSLVSMIKKMIQNNNDDPKSLVKQFYYPDTGTGLIYEKMKEMILKNGGKIKTKSYPLKISHDREKINHIILNECGTKKKVEVENVISSIPITDFVNMLNPKPKRQILRCIEHLKFRSHVSLFISIDKTSIFPDQWIYFPDREMPFGRIMEPKNFSKKMSPSDKTSLVIEFFCWEGDRMWKATKKSLLELSLKWLEKLGFLEKKDIISCHINTRLSCLSDRL